jgi:arylsulfatase A-like enzyme
VALAAVAPTLLEVAGIPAPATMQAKSLFPMIEEAKIDKTKFVETDKRKMKERPIYSETNYAHRAFGWSELRS